MNTTFKTQSLLFSAFNIIHSVCEKEDNIDIENKTSKDINVNINLNVDMKEPKLNKLISPICFS